jgi:AraC family transcriptional regulator
MDEVIEKAVERVIKSIYENLGEPMSIDSMARTAMFSKFHFSRIFQRVTGISPARFLSAVRLQEAKQILVSTSLTVTEICHRVGYNSIGTFSSRFRASVGVSPTEYRQRGGLSIRIPVDIRRNVNGARLSAIQGHIWPPPVGQPGPIFVGLFPDRIPQGQPVSCTVRHRPGPYVMDDVPEGTWHLLAQCAAADYQEAINGQHTVDGSDTFVATHGPITIPPDAVVPDVDLWLRPRCIFDPPALLAALDARSVAFNTLVFRCGSSLGSRGLMGIGPGLRAGSFELPPVRSANLCLGQTGTE